MKRVIFFLIIVSILVLVLPVSASDVAVPATVMSETIIANQAPTAIVVHDFEIESSKFELVLVFQGLLIALGTMLLLNPLWRAKLLDGFGRKPQLQKIPVSPDNSSPLAVAPQREDES